MDFNSVFGLLLAFAAVIGGQILEGGNAGSLLQTAAFLIVVGGTIGAVLLQSPIKIFIRGVKMASWVFFPPIHSPQIVIKQIINWAYIVRKDGLLALENYVPMVKEPLMKKGLQLLADGNTADKLREAMEIDIIANETNNGNLRAFGKPPGGMRRLLEYLVRYSVSSK